MSRLCSFSSCFSRFHFRGVFVALEHTRSVQRGKLIFPNTSCSVCAVKVMLFDYGGLPTMGMGHLVTRSPGTCPVT